MATTRVVIDADGDLLLTVRSLKDAKNDANHANAQDDETETVNVELQVSSKVMTLASPVFKTLLRGRFKEGVEFAETQQSTEPYALDLPEDDCEAITVLAKILHFDLDGISTKPSPSCLENLAFLCDKYQCTGVLKYSGGIWLRDWIIVFERDNAPSIDSLCRLLVFAYVANLAVEFKDIAWRLFLYHKGPFLGKYTQAVVLVDHPLLGHDLPEYLDAERFKCCQMVHDGIMYPLNRQWEPANTECFRAAKALREYLAVLRASAFLPHDLQFSTHKFADIVGTSIAWISTSRFECTRYKCTCPSEVGIDLTSSLRTQLSLIADKQRDFICLDCIRSDGLSSERGSCRLDHRKAPM